MSEKSNISYGKYILVEGEIGAGKTTLIDHLVRATGWYEFPEPVANHPYLESYYAEPKKMAYMMQKWTQHMRGGAMFQAAIRGHTGGMSILDRGLPGDWAFAYANWKEGNISDDEWQLYQQDLENFWKIHIPPACIVHVDVSTETLLARIASRGRAMEQGIQPSYLNLLKEGLRLSLQMYTERYGVPVLRIDNNTWCEPDRLSYGVSVGNKMSRTPAHKLHEQVLKNMIAC